MSENEKIHYVSKYIQLYDSVDVKTFIEYINSAIEIAKKEGAIEEGSIELIDACEYREHPYKKIFYCYKTPENEDEKKKRLRREEELNKQMKIYYEALKKRFEKEKNE